MAIHLLTGNGRGKTTSAIGTAVRMLGHNKKVLILQFMKGRKNTGEYQFLKKIKNCEIAQFGRKGFVNLENPSARDKLLAQQGIEFLKRKLASWKTSKSPDLLILDEINLACRIKLADAKEVAAILKKLPKKMEVILTGRYAPKVLADNAEYITRMNDIKHARKTIKGIHY